MITLRKFFIGLLALTALVVVAYSVYEMTPERRARRIAARWQRLGDESIEKFPDMDFMDRKRFQERYKKRVEPLLEELLEIACRCEPPIDNVAEHWWVDKEGCLYSELLKEVSDHWLEKGQKEMARRALEESRR